jgi:hypothetical protein
MAIGPVNTPPVPPGPSTETPASPKGASAGDISKFERGLNAAPTKEAPGKMSDADLKSEIKALNDKASRFPGLDANEKQRLTELTSELSTRSGQQTQAQSQSPGSSILDKMR